MTVNSGAEAPGACALEAATVFWSRAVLVKVHSSESGRPGEVFLMSNVLSGLGLLQGVQKNREQAAFDT